MSILSKLLCRFNTVLSKSPAAFFFETDKLILDKNTIRTANAILKKNEMEELGQLVSKLKSYSNQNRVRAGWVNCTNGTQSKGKSLQHDQLTFLR